MRLRPRTPVTFSMIENLTRQITTQTAKAATGNHHAGPTSVASCNASATPPISAVTVIKLIKKGRRQVRARGAWAQAFPESTVSQIFRVAAAATHLAVHVFDREHLGVVELFGEQTGDEINKFDRCAWHRGPAQMPILDDAAAWFVGTIVDRFSLGDHVGHLLEPMDGDPPDGLEHWVSFRDVHGSRTRPPGVAGERAAPRHRRRPRRTRDVLRRPAGGVRANMIFSADGGAAFGGRAGPLSCPTDQQLLAALRAIADVVLAGAGTARAENYGPVRLTAAQRERRRAMGRDEPPPIAVVSRTGDLPDRSFGEPDQPPILVTTASAVEQRGLASDRRWRVLVAGDESVDVARAVAALRAQGLHRILCEGGPTLLDELVDADLVDEMCVTIAPRLVGSQPVGRRPAPARLGVPVAMRLRHALIRDDYLFLKYGR